MPGAKRRFLRPRWNPANVHTGGVNSREPINRPALGVALAFAVSQDILYALVFLSFMNHYLLDVLDTSPGFPGYTLALYGGTRLIVHPLAGRLLDLTRPRVVYVASLIVQLTAVVSLTITQSLPLFLVAAVLLAIGSATIWPLTYALVAATQPAEQRGRIGGMLAIAGYVSTGVGFATGILLAEVAANRAAFAIAAVLIALPALLLTGHTLGVRALHTEHESATRQSGPSRGLILFGLVLFLDFAAISAIAGVYGPYARRTLDLSLLQTAILLLPAGIAAALSLAIVSRFSRSNRRFLEMAVLYALAGAGALALALTNVPAAASAVAIILGLGAGGIAPLIAATLLDVGFGKGRGVVIGTLMSLEGLGSVAGPGAVAFVTDFQGPRAGFAVIAALFAVLVPLSFVAFRHFEPVIDSPQTG